MNEELDTRSHAPAQPIAPASALRLVVREGPDVGRSLVVPLSQGTRVHVGTSSICELRLSCATVSRRHLVLESLRVSAAYGQKGELRELALRVTDLDSTNGTLLSGVPVVSAYVRSGDTLQLGATVLRVEEAEAEVDAPRSAMRFGRLVGASDAMRRLYPLCERLCKVNVPTLIEGEKGTGKERLAESLHEASGRTGPFVVLDCGAGNAETLAIELFGQGDRPGLFEQAEGGTLLLDEVGEWPAPLQASLARTIERGDVRRVGDVRGRRFDVRVLSSSRRDLDRLVQAGRFEERLFVCLGATHLELPPLRARSGDVTLLARAFVEALGCAPLDAGALAAFEDYAWPGNVTELKNAVTRLALLGETDPPSGDAGAAAEPYSPPNAGDFLDRIVSSDCAFSVARRKVIAEFERRYVETLLEKNDGNVSRAAAASGVALRHFQRVKSRRV